MNKFFMGLGAIAALSLAACSSEEPSVNPDLGTDAGDGSTAYMTVVINAAGNSRGSSGTGAENFLQSTTENYVKNAQFYFYTKEGEYVTTAQVWGGGDASTDDTKNIEFEGKTVLVLKDLNSKNAPAYIVTVLNAPAGFTHGQTLKEMEAKLALATEDAKGYTTGSTTEGSNVYPHFMMSTSSYIRTAPINAEYEYFTTKVTQDNFLQYTDGTVPSASAIATMTPVQIYVERLAAKVSVDFTTTDPANVETVGGKKYLKVKVSGGNVINNADPDNWNGYEVADMDIYVGIDGWGLTNLSKNSYMMKNLANDTYDGWNGANRYRFYWAKAANIYGFTDEDILQRYALKDFVTDYNAASFNPADAIFKLGLGNVDYCFENTNNTTSLTKNNLGQLATSALVFARVYKKVGETMVPATMVSYNGIIFAEEDFYNMILNALQATKKYAYTTTADPSTYHQISKNEIQFNSVANSNDGEVTLSLTTAAAGYNWYTYTADVIPTDPSGFTATTAADLTTALTAVVENKAISSQAAHVYVYNGGLMYYNVPIEHYRSATPDLNNLQEGDYGVVRNHIYQLTINKVARIGKAIYDPENVIIPDTPNTEDRYALGVKVNILSWKIVTQGVDL